MGAGGNDTGLPAPTQLEEALAIIRQYPDWVEEMSDPETFFRRIILPHRLGRCAVVDGVYYAWAWLPYIRKGLPAPEDWASTEGPFWVMDCIWDRRHRAADALYIAKMDALARGIVEEGEPVLFYRNAHGRYGRNIIRARKQNGFGTQDTDGGQRSVEEHARVARGELQVGHGDARRPARGCPRSRAPLRDGPERGGAGGL